MPQVIVYQTDEGGVAVVHPAPNSVLTIQEIAEKDVPTGKPYKIVADTDIPTDRRARSSWTVNVSDLTDGVGQ